MRPSSFSKPRQDDVVEVGNYLGEDRLKVTTGRRDRMSRKNVEEVFMPGEHEITTAEIWRYYDGSRVIVYRIPKDVDVEDLMVAITHEWLHIALFKCGERQLPEELIELVARVSIKEV
jgi:hypothetical protein